MNKPAKNKEIKKALYKAKVNSILGIYWLVVEVPADLEEQEVKSLMYSRIYACDKLETKPAKTNKTFIKGAKNCFDIQPYYRIFD